MRRFRFWAFAAAFGGLAGLAPVGPAQVRERPAAAAAVAPPPRLDPVAEAKLLMNGLNKPNFDGLGRLLKQKPADGEAWAFARGQALLIAESGNLLMLRPPKTRPAQDAWLQQSAELRESAARLARATGDRDYQSARAGLAELANACNRCHQTFRVATRVTPFDVAE